MISFDSEVISIEASSGVAIATDVVSFDQSIETLIVEYTAEADIVALSELTLQISSF